jgi:parvulin-like peptidyl-prolyl isomerase
MAHLGRILANAAALLTVLVCPVAADLKPDQPAARVNGETITVGQLQQECLARFGAGTLQQMIDYLLVEQAAKKRNVTVEPKEIAARIRAFQLQVELGREQTGRGFAEWSAMRRVSLRELAANARMELLLEKMVADSVRVTDEEVANYYQANREKLKQPERMLISHIAVEKREDAERIRQELLAGKITFADAARKYSIDPYGRENGGLFGWIVRGDDPIQKAAFALTKDGDLSPVVQGRKGFEIIRRDSYQSERIPTFEEVEKDLRELLRQQKTQRLAQEMLEELRRQANVERLLNFDTLNQDLQPIIEASHTLQAPPQGERRQ